MTREEAIKILKAIRVYECYPKSASEETKEAIDMAIALSAERTGEWISLFDGNEWFVMCSKCKTQHYEEDLLMGGSELPNFCPNCGADMRGEQDE